MPVSISRLRRWFAGTLIAVCVIVAIFYFGYRHRVQNALKQVPEKIGIQIQQSAQGFTISKSEQGRTLFKLQASKAIQYKQGGRVELHEVTITVYGRDSSRFDQVYGKDFEYDQQSGNVTSLGEVGIDLQSNPQGILNADQVPPKELKNPIHLKTTQLVFNQKTGDAWTPAEIDFSVPQASGSAVGAKYVAKDGELTLQSQVKIVATGDKPATILAGKAVLTKNPREIVLDQPRADSPDRKAQADELTLWLRDDNTLDRALAMGNISLSSLQAPPAARGAHLRSQNATARAMPVKTSPPEWSRVRAQQLDVSMTADNVVERAVLSGNVRFSSEGPQAMQAFAGRSVLSFGAKNTLNKIHAEDGVKLLQSNENSAEQADGRALPSLQGQRNGNGLAAASNAAAQDVEVTAPAMDFLVADRQRLTRAETIGAPEITLASADSKQAGPTRITAEKFISTFDSLGQLSHVHGEGHAKVISPAAANSVSHRAGAPAGAATATDRVSTSDRIDATFRPGQGIEVITQQGQFTYTSGTQQAFADSARYTPANQIVTLSGSPRITDAGMETTARSVRLNRATGEGFADGNVKTSYSDLKPLPGGALLAGSDPIHVTAQSMVARSNPSVATYNGDARLWQDANVVRAPSIQFQKDERMLIAKSSAGQKVSTVLVGTDKKGNATPVMVESNQLAYRDSERKAHFTGNVTVRSTDMTITAEQMDVFLAPAQSKNAQSKNTDRGAPSPPQATPAVSQGESDQGSSLGPAKLEKIVASGSVVITEPNRRATGQQLTYTASDDKFVLTGGPPCIFDAEHGKITGVSLTLFRRDGRVVVEGDSSSPAVTQTRVVR